MMDNSENKTDKEAEKKIEERREKIRIWLKDPYNLGILAILLIGFAIRIYYFFLTYNQTLWHDEAEYAVMAKHFLGIVNYPLNPQRIFLFPGVISAFFLVGLSEEFVKFALVLLPSTFLIFCVYLLGKEMFDKRIALIASLLTAVSWTFLFWTARLQPDFLSMCFQVLAVLFMWKYWKNNKTKHIVLSGVFISLGFLFKVSAMLVPVIFFIFILLKDRLSAFKNKDYWIFLVAFLVFLIPEFIYAFSSFGNPGAVFGTTYVTAVVDERPFGWYNLNYYYYLTENVVFLLFIFGLILALEILLYFDVLLKDKNKCFNPNLFSVLVFVIVSVYYIFYIKGTDDRWVFLWLPFIFFIAGKSVSVIYERTEKYNKIIAIAIVVALLSSAVYFQLKHTDSLIKLKKDSYSQVKEAAFWIKENSNKEDLIITASLPQTIYYGERKVVPYSPPASGERFDFKNESDFEEFVNSKKPRYIVVSGFEHHAPWVLKWVEANQNELEVKQVYYSDAQQTSPSLIIYEPKY